MLSAPSSSRVSLLLVLLSSRENPRGRWFWYRFDLHSVLRGRGSPLCSSPTHPCRSLCRRLPCRRLPLLALWLRLLQICRFGWLLYPRPVLACELGCGLDLRCHTFRPLPLF